MIYSNLQVANTIQQQLGGARFRVMTGAKQFVGGENFLQFKLPAGAAKKINFVKITLADNDTYSVEFMNFRGLNVKTVSIFDTVYADQLAQIFTAETGLFTKF